MAFEALRQHYRERGRAYRSPQGLERLAADLGSRLSQAAPNETGTLAEAVGQVGPLQATAAGFTIGVGNQERLGGGQAAPAGTLSAFLEDHPRYRMPAEAFETATDARGRPWEPRLAWWFLPLAGRAELAEARAGGQYGGPMYTSGGPAPYYGVQDAAFPEWQASAGAAGLESSDWTRFTDEALAAWRGEDLPRGLREVLGAG